jgi:hypothetical protein
VPVDLGFRSSDTSGPLRREVLDPADELDPAPEPVRAEVVEVTVDRAWPTTED